MRHRCCSDLWQSSIKIHLTFSHRNSSSALWTDDSGCFKYPHISCQSNPYKSNKGKTEMKWTGKKQTHKKQQYGWLSYNTVSSPPPTIISLYSCNTSELEGSKTGAISEESNPAADRLKTPHEQHCYVFKIAFKMSLIMTASSAWLLTLRLCNIIDMHWDELYQTLGHVQ